MTTAALEQQMESPVRAERPLPSWVSPENGSGEIDFDNYYQMNDAARRLMSTTRTLQRFIRRIPHVVTLGGHRYFRKDMIEAIRAELLHGRDIDIALQNIGVESPPTE